MNAESIWQPLGLTLALASVTTLLLLLFGLPLAYWLNRLSGFTAIFSEALVGLPIVLPPTVLGYYLLVAFAPDSFFGGFWAQVFGRPLAFSFPGLVAGSMLYSLPFAIQPYQNAFRGIPSQVVEAAALEANPIQTFWHIRLPLATRGILVGSTLVFAHTLGEFGVVLMIGGDIPGETRVASIALFNEMQKLNFGVAHFYAVILLAVSFVLLSTVTLIQRRLPFW
jgi:molybdate transport system permease protein